MWADIRVAVRVLARWRLGALAAILTLAIGIATTTALAAVARLMVPAFPGVPDIARLARIHASAPGASTERAQVTLDDFDSKLARATSFESIGAYAQTAATIGSQADARPVVAAYASPGFFSAIGVSPYAGRWFSTADQDTWPVVILGDRLWRREFPDGRMAGASLIVNGVERAVVGVMPPEFSYGFVGINADLWIPLSRAFNDHPSNVAVFARLRSGIDWPAATAELEALAGDHAPRFWRVVPIQSDSRYRAVGAYSFTLGPALVILLIACVNVACMLMARGVARDKELSVRLALGATRGRVARQLFVEHLVLAVAGGMLGSVVAVGMLRVLGAIVANAQPDFASRLPSDVGLLPLALGATVMACLLFGTIPAMRLSRYDLSEALKGVPAKYRVRVAGYGARDLIVFLETGSAVGLLVVSAMFFRVFTDMEHVGPRFPADRAIVVHVPVRELETVKTRVLALPGIAEVTVASGIPGSEVSWRSSIQVHTDTEPPRAMQQISVDASYFETLGLPLVRGRSFDASEGEGVVVLSERAARLMSPMSDPIGLRIHLGGTPNSTAVVIGVSRDAMTIGSLSAIIPPELYVPYGRPASSDAILHVRVSTDPSLALRAIRGVMPPSAIARSQEPRILADVIRMGNPNASMVIVRVCGGFGAVALLLAAAGIFAVIGQSVAQRTTEFGVRMALGATPRRVLGMVLVRETKLIAVALLSGAGVTLAITRASFVELAQVSIASPSLWVEVVIGCGGVALASCLLATRHIVRLDPWIVLRRL